MSRSTKKGPFIDPKLAKKIEELNKSGEKKVIKTWARASVISPDFVGHTLAVHTGKKFQNVYVSEHMVGHRVGEFAQTRTYRGHGSFTKQTNSLK